MKISNAFTLIELLIVVTIIGLFSGLSLAYYNNFGEQAKLKEETRKLVDVLELAKKKADAGDTPTSCGSGFSGYQVTVNNNSYILYYCCGGVCNNLVQTYNITSNISIVSGTGNILFQPLSATNITPVQIQVKNSSLGASSNCLYINISSVGIATVDDNLHSC